MLDDEGVPEAALSGPFPSAGTLIARAEGRGPGGRAGQRPGKENREGDTDRFIASVYARRVLQPSSRPRKERKAKGEGWQADGRAPSSGPLRPSSRAAPPCGPHGEPSARAPACVYANKVRTAVPRSRDAQDCLGVAGVVRRPTSATCLAPSPRLVRWSRSALITSRLVPQRKYRGPSTRPSSPAGRPANRIGSDRRG